MAQLPPFRSLFLQDTSGFGVLVYLGISNLGVLIFPGIFFREFRVFLAIFAKLNTREIFLDVKSAKIKTREIFLQLKFAKINTNILSLSDREDKKDIIFKIPCIYFKNLIG